MKRGAYLLFAFGLITAGVDILGWSERVTHPSQTQQALWLIESLDEGDSRYREIYFNHWWPELGGPRIGFYNATVHRSGLVIPSQRDHPVVIGAFTEDMYGQKGLLPNGGYPNHLLELLFDKVRFGSLARQRDFNHFGVDPADEGLRWLRRFATRGGAEHPNDRFSVLHPDCRRASDEHFPASNLWARGGALCQNRNGFQDAIEVYRHYTFEAVREAYRRMGHVVHLLQDMGQPDHARGIWHPCSDDRKLDLVDRLISARPECPPGLGSGLGDVCDEIRGELPDLVGFETFARLTWSEIEGDLDTLALDVPAVNAFEPPPEEGYLWPFEYVFREVANRSREIAEDLGHRSDRPLGCHDSERPAIRIKDADQRERFHELAVELNRLIVSRSAALLRHHFETVNYPPYVREVAITQADAGSGAGGRFTVRWNDVVEAAPELSYVKPVEFSSSGFPTYALSHTVREFTPQVVRRRQLEREPATPLGAGLVTRLQVRIGPNVVVPKRMARVEARFAGSTLPLRRAGDSPDGETWVAELRLPCRLDDAASALLTIAGEDAEAHLPWRDGAGIPTGSSLDSDPSTLAYASAERFPTWEGYEPGDSSFRIRVRDLDPLALLAASRVFSRIGRVPGATVAQVYRGLRDAELEANLNQRFEVTLRARTSGGVLPVASLGRCIDLEWRLSDTARTEDGRTVRLSDVDLRVGLEIAAASAEVFALPGDGTPLGTYTVTLTIRDRRSGVTTVLPLSFEVVELAESFERLWDAWRESGGFDGPRSPGRREFFDWLRTAEGVIRPPRVRPDCPSPVTSCWYQDRGEWRGFGEWLGDRAELEAIRLWLGDPGIQLDGRQRRNATRFLELFFIARQRAALIRPVVEGQATATELAARHGVTVEEVRRWEKRYFSGGAPLSILRLFDQVFTGGPVAGEITVPGLIAENPTQGR